MNNPALILTHNNILLTQQCVDSLREQDIPVDIFIIDNGSSDDTVSWASREGILLEAFPTNTGFSHGINVGMKRIFNMGYEWCLAPNNDTYMPTYYYRILLEQNMPVVSGVQEINGHRVKMEDLAMIPPVQPIRPHPDFSALLFRKSAWETLGGFDESMALYCSDCDLHLRAHRLGVIMNHIHAPFLHHGSSTLRNSSPKERRKLDLIADADRLAFLNKWGFTEGSEEYAKQFVPELFGIDAKEKA